MTSAISPKKYELAFYLTQITLRFSKTLQNTLNRLTTILFIPSTKSGTRYVLNVQKLPKGELVCGACNNLLPPWPSTYASKNKPCLVISPLFFLETVFDEKKHVGRCCQHLMLWPEENPIEALQRIVWTFEGPGASSRDPCLETGTFAKAWLLKPRPLFLVPRLIKIVSQWWRLFYCCYVCGRF